MSKRKSISKTIRFDVFKRDNFTCQYCGKKAPDVTLEVDHIKPVSKGGSNSILNLITSCYDCNRGKSNKTLKENQTLSKELKQMEILAQRKEQIEMLFKWQNELIKQDDLIIDKIDEYIFNLMGYGLDDDNVIKMKSLLKKYDLNEIVNGLQESYKTYDEPEIAVNNLSRVLSVIRLQKKKPYMKELFYIRGIMRNKYHYCDDKKAIQHLTELYEIYDVPIKEIKQNVLSCNTWSQFIYWYDGYVYGE